MGHVEHGVEIDLAVGGGAGSQSGGQDLLAVGVINHVAQVHHVAVDAPVSYQALGALHDDVGGVAAGEGGVHLVVAVGVGQPLHGDLDAGIRGKLVDQGLYLGLIAPAAHGIDPDGDGVGRSAAGGGGIRGALVAALIAGGGRSGALTAIVLAAAGGQRQRHGHGQSRRNNFLHLHCVSSF